jgi:hypothetical protein
MPLSKSDFFSLYEKLYQQLGKDRESLLEQYKNANQKYPIGFTFPYKGETAKINGCFAYLFEPDTDHLDYDVFIAYSCYVPRICDQEIQDLLGKMTVIGDHKNSGVIIFEAEIDRVLECGNKPIDK